MRVCVPVCVCVCVFLGAFVGDACDFEEKLFLKSTILKKKLILKS